MKGKFPETVQGLRSTNGAAGCFELMERLHYLSVCTTVRNVGQTGAMENEEKSKGKRSDGDKETRGCTK